MMWVYANQEVVVWPFDWHATLNNNIVSYWKSDTNWSFLDATPSWNDGTINWATFTASWKINWAYDYDWINDFVEVADDASLDFGWWDFTFSFWINPDNVTQNNKWLIGKRDGTVWTNAGYSIRQFTTNIFVRTFDGTNNVDNTITTWLTSGSFQFITVTFTWWGNVEVFRNAVSKWTWSIATVWSMDFATALFIWAEEMAWAWSNFYDWKLDEIAVWSRVLTGTEITDLYASWSWLQY